MHLSNRQLFAPLNSPCSGRWALACDTVGRVALLQTRQPLLLALLKGYRAAQAIWAAAPGPRGGLAILVYAPRRGRLEAWTPDLRTRLAALSGLASHAALLAAPPGHAEGAVWFLDLRALRCADVGPALWASA